MCYQRVMNDSNVVYIMVVPGILRVMITITNVIVR